MIGGKSVIAVIPARGGSKRLPRKNILPLLGKPLIVWTIESALHSDYVDTVCLSTDSPDIASVAADAGASVPFLRPAEFSGDAADSAGVLLHALDYYRAEGRDFDYAVLLQPTTPLRSAADIDASLELCLEKGAESVTSLCEADHSPLWENTLPADNSMTEFDRDIYSTMRSQDLPKYYRYNGAIYVVATEAFRATRDFVSRKSSFAYIMPRERSVDIDEAMDFVIAEAIMRRLDIH